MKGLRRVTGLATIAALCLLSGNGLKAYAQAPPAGQDSTAPKYTMAEYNAYQACSNEKVPAVQIRCLDDFVSKYPNSTLLVYIYPLYYQAYAQQKNYAKVIEYASKVTGMGDKVEPAIRFNACYAHAAAYSTLLTDPAKGKEAAQDQALAKAAKEDVDACLKTLDGMKKPEGATDAAWDADTKKFRMGLYGFGAQAASVQKDYAAAINFYKAALALNPDDAITSYNLGRAYLALNPPQQIDGFWYIARAVTSKTATQQQSAQLKTYLRKLIVNYQGGTVCDSLTDAELNELLQLAGSSAQRPESYKSASAADLTATQKDMTILSVFTDLKAGGEKSKLTWLAACGLEFQEVPGKVIEVAPGSDAIVLKIAFVTSDAEFEAATTPNMEVRVVGQPDAARVEKNSPIHFNGTLVSYDPEPSFFLHWDKAKVKAEDIPKEKGAPKKPVRRPTPRKPGTKPT